MEKIKVLVADDSAFMRKLIQDILSSSNQIEIVGTARNGQEAIKKIKELKPNVVTMDVEMPILNGIEALKIIMAEDPVPIVMLSSTTKEGAENTLHAIQLGAVDFIAKPSGPISLDLKNIRNEIVEKVLSASKANLSSISRNLQKKELFSTKLLNCSNIKLEKELEKSFDLKSTNPKWERSLKKLVCIGTSTGGPRALQAVLAKLPADIQAPVVIVQHMPPGFTKSLANRLDSLSQIKVKEAEDGEVLKNGVAYITPGGYHLKLKRNFEGLVIQLDQSLPRSGHRPSVDVMFESISAIPDFAKIAVIMTGMGADGAKGLIQLKKSGKVKAIAESMETSIVFGMPKAAISTNLVDEVQDVEDITKTILKFI